MICPFSLLTGFLPSLVQGMHWPHSLFLSFSVQKCILKNAEKLVELCVAKLSQDWFPLLDLLAMVLNPQCK